MENGDDEATATVHIPKRTLIAVLLIALGGSVPLNMYVQKATPEMLAELVRAIETKPEARSDPFTGTEGRALKDLITETTNRTTVIEQRLLMVPPEQMRTNTIDIALLKAWLTSMQNETKEIHDDCENHMREWHEQGKRR